MCNALAHIKKGGACENRLLKTRWTGESLRQLIGEDLSRQSFYNKITFLREELDDDDVKDITNHRVNNRLGFVFPENVADLTHDFQRDKGQRQRLKGINSKEMCIVFLLSVWQRANTPSSGESPRLTGFLEQLREYGWESIRAELQSAIGSTTKATTLEALLQSALTKYWAANPETIEVEKQTITVKKEEIYVN